jgi:predicted RNA-binding protein YlqC (UPF0109 family)
MVTGMREKIFIDHPTLLPIISEYSKRTAKRTIGGISLESDEFEKVVSKKPRLYKQLKSLIREIDDKVDSSITVPLTNITMIYEADEELPWVAESPHILNRLMPSRLHSTLVFNFQSVGYIRGEMLKSMGKLPEPDENYDSRFLHYLHFVKSELCNSYINSIKDGIIEEAIATFRCEYDYVSRDSKWYWRKKKIDDFIKEVEEGEMDEELGYGFIYVLGYRLTNICDALGIKEHDLYSKELLDKSKEKVTWPHHHIFHHFNELKKGDFRGERAIERLRELVNKEFGCKFQVLDAKSANEELQNIIERMFVRSLNDGVAPLASLLCLISLISRSSLVIGRGVDTHFCLIMPSVEERDIAPTARALVALMCFSGNMYLRMREGLVIDSKGGDEIDLEGIGTVKIPSFRLRLPSMSDLQEPLDLLYGCLGEYWKEVVRPKVRKYGAEEAFHILTGGSSC